jgi:filamentous hemagglutinin
MKKTHVGLGFGVFALVGLLLKTMIRGGSPASQHSTQSPQSQASTIGSEFGQPHIGAVKGSMPVLKDISVIDFGKNVYRGDMDINPTIDRIRRGEKLSHPNDGSYFTNRERSLPSQNDRQFYREFVHKMRGFSFPGPQRVIIGKDGNVWYTGDHYASFIQVTK